MCTFADQLRGGSFRAAAALDLQPRTPRRFRVLLARNVSRVKIWQLVVAVLALIAVAYLGLVIVVDRFILQPVH